MKNWIKNVSLTLSENGMEAVLKIRKNRAQELPTFEELKQYIQSYGIVYGIQEEVIRQALAPGFEGAVESHVVARGGASVEPLDDIIEYPFDFSEMGSPKTLPDGSVDLKDLQLIRSVKKGDVLARRIPGRYGSAGQTIRGEPIVIRAMRVVRLPQGIHTVPSPENQNILIAAKDGHVVKIGEAVNVYEEHVIQGDVDYSTGNVHYTGSLRVEGSIRSGFTVETDGNLLVQGDIEDANVSCGGNLIVRGGVIGKGKCLISVAGDVEARYVNGHHLRALGDISLQDECVNAKIECGGTVFLWKKGVLIGGESYVFNRLDARIIGSESGTYTDVYFGLDTVFSRALVDLSRSKQEYLEKSALCRQALYKVLLNASRNGREPVPEELAEVAELKHELFREYDRIGKIEEREEKVRERKEAPVSPGVVVRDRIYAGVKIAGATTSFFVKNPQKVRGVYQLKGPNVAFVPLT